MAAMAFSVASLVAAVHHACARDPKKRDYAYTVCKLTIVVCSLGSFSDPDGAVVLQSVVLRVLTIMLGGVIALVCSLIVLPEYASEAQSSVLAKACSEVDALFAALVRAHGAPPTGKRPQPLPELHGRELKLAALLERYAALLTQAGEERRLRLGRHLVRVEEAAAAGAAVRALFTGAVALLHVCESTPRTAAGAAMHASHAAEIGEASGALSRALHAAGALCAAQAEGGAEAEAAAAAALLALRQLDEALRRLVERAEASGEAAAGGAEQREAYRSLSLLVAALQDADACVSRLVANSLPDEHTGLAGEWTAQRALAAARLAASTRVAALVSLAQSELERVDAQARQAAVHFRSPSKRRLAEEA